jgi:hypothetical protein
MKAGRNDPCPCGSGKKYKHCCYAKDSVKHEEPVIEAPVSEEPEDEEEAEAIEARRKSQRKDRSRFEGEVKGGGSGFQPRQTRGSQRGS